jgi:hypothetical protein
VLECWVLEAGGWRVDTRHLGCDTPLGATRRRCATEVSTTSGGPRVSDHSGCGSRDGREVGSRDTRRPMNSASFGQAVGGRGTRGGRDRPERHLGGAVARSRSRQGPVIADDCAMPMLSQLNHPALGSRGRPCAGGARNDGDDARTRARDLWRQRLESQFWAVAWPDQLLGGHAWHQSGVVR